MLIFRTLRVLLYAGCATIAAAQPAVQGVVQLGDYGATLSPGTLAMVVGKELASAMSQCQPKDFVPPDRIRCGDVAVSVGGRPAFVLFASATQLSIQIPTELTPGTYPLVADRLSGTQKLTSAPVNITLDAVSPALVPTYTTPAGQAFAMNTKMYGIASNMPAARGESLTLIALGMGQTDPPLATAQTAQQGTWFASAVTATLGGLPADVLSAAPAFGTPGMGQITMKVPAALQDGPQPLRLLVQGKQSQAGVTLPVSDAAGIARVQNSFSYDDGVSPGAWGSAFGVRMNSKFQVWTGDDIVAGVLPTRLGDVSVKVDGRPAAIYFADKEQINFLTPADTQLGKIKIEVTTPAGTTSFETESKKFLPGFHLVSGKFVTALFSDWSYAAKPGLLPATIPSRTAKPGDALVFYGTGFGPTVPGTDTSRAFSGSALLDPAAPLTVRIGGVAAKIVYAGMVSNGLVQINLVVPDVPDGDQEVIAEIGGARSAAGRLLTIKR